MPTFNKFNDYSEQKNRGAHNWGSNAFKLVLTNSAPIATNSALADITQISAGNGYTTGGNATTITISESSGTTTVQGTEVTFTASGGTMATFRYYVLYNDTATSPADALVAWWDHGSAVSLTDGSSFTVRFNNASPGTILTDA